MSFKKEIQRLKSVEGQINAVFSSITGLVVLDRDKRRFSDIMEEKANKLGKSWKDPGKKIKLVSRLSQSDVKDVNQQGMLT